MTESTTKTLQPADVIRLVVALSRAEVQPFTRSDWHGWAGATGEAHVVHFRAEDQRYLLDRLGMETVPNEYATVILDEMGVSWNINSPVNAFAWMVQVELQQGMHDGPTPEQYWEVDATRPYGSALDQEIAALPEEARVLVMACPESARAHVVRGYYATHPVSTNPVPQPQVWVFKNELSQWEVRGQQPSTPAVTTLQTGDTETLMVTWARNNVPGARLMHGAPPAVTAEG